jgi:predicted DNA-binding transcriptional regulator AlpA
MTPMTGLRSEREVAALLCVALPTVRRWRVVRIGPAWLKIGRAVYYRDADISAWIDSQRQEPTKG